MTIAFLAKIKSFLMFFKIMDMGDGASIKERGFFFFFEGGCMFG